MKKLCALVVVTFIIIFMISNKKEKTMLANTYLSEKNMFEYKQILIKIDNLNTNNFHEYFNNMNVLLVYPYINPVYKDRINMIYVYKSMDKLKDYYINKLESFGYYLEANKYLYTPIKIDAVLIYSNLEELRQIYSDKVIEECQNSSFYCVKLK